MTAEDHVQKSTLLAVQGLSTSLGRKGRNVPTEQGHLCGTVTRRWWFDSGQDLGLSSLQGFAV